MELQVTEIEECLDQVKSDLLLANEDRQRLEKVLEEEKSANKVTTKILISCRTALDLNILYDNM